MSDARLFLFDDRRARRWAPFTLTRPMGELLFGCLSNRERSERVLGTRCLGHISRAALVGFDEPHAPPAIALEDVGEEGRRVLLSSRAILDFEVGDLPEGPTTLVLGGEVVGWVIPDGAPLPSELWLRDPASAPAGDETRVLPGSLLSDPWDVIERNAQRLRDDMSHLWPEDDETPGAHRIGTGNVSLGEGSSIEPGVHLDVRDGPIRLAEGVSVEGPARLTGPLYVGPGSTIFGGAVGISSIGPVCIVRGEVTDSVFLGFVNKAHDGHIGHAMLGRWVNLGAGTTNSDLKNNYGTVRVWTPEGDIDSGAIKIGCFVGDHVKTGIGTMINTGSVFGAGSNVFGGAMPPVVVPPFSWGVGSQLGEHKLDKFLETAELAMARRDQELTPGVRTVLKRAWNRTAYRRADPS